MYPRDLRRRRATTVSGPRRSAEQADCSDMPRKGTNGVSTNGVTANFIFFDRGTFWVLPLIYFDILKSARAYLFPQSVKIHYFAAAPLVSTPLCQQPKQTYFSVYIYIYIYIEREIDMCMNIYIYI